MSENNLIWILFYIIIALQEERCAWFITPPFCPFTRTPPAEPPRDCYDGQIELNFNGPPPNSSYKKDPPQPLYRFSCMWSTFCITARINNLWHSPTAIWDTVNRSVTVDLMCIFRRWTHRDSRFAIIARWWQTTDSREGIEGEWTTSILTINYYNINPPTTQSLLSFLPFPNATTRRDTHLPRLSSVKQRGSDIIRGVFPSHLQCKQIERIH